MNARVGDENPIATGLSRFFADNGLGNCHVSNVSAASTGARRSNVLFDLAADDQPSRRLVATIMPAGQLQLNDIETEAEVRRVVRAHGVSVPEVIGATSDPSYVGGPFFVSAFVEGESIPRRVLRLVEAHGNGPGVVSQIGESLARLHSIDPDLLPAAALSSRSLNPCAEAVAEARAAVDQIEAFRPALEWAVAWLDANLPPPAPLLTPVHTDVRNGNVLVSVNGLEAILDWEGLRRKGDPMADLAWTAVRTWRFRNDSLEIGGMAPRSSLIDGYEAHGGTFDEARFHWWKVSMTLWWALGLHAQAQAHLDGTYSHIVMAASGRRVPELEWDLLMLTRP